MAEGRFTSEIIEDYYANAAPAEDVTLTERDADAVLEELLPAQTQS